MGCIVAEHGAGDDRFRPFVLQVHLRRGDVELAVEARQQRLEPSALFFERGTGREVEMKGESANHGKL